MLFAVNVKIYIWIGVCLKGKQQSKFIMRTWEYSLEALFYERPTMALVQ